MQASFSVNGRRGLESAKGANHLAECLQPVLSDENVALLHLAHLISTIKDGKRSKWRMI